MSCRGKRGTLGRRPLTHPNRRRLCTNTLARIAIQGQGRRSGWPRLSRGRNWPSPHAVQRRSQTLGGGTETLRPDCQGNAEETLTRRAEATAGENHNTVFFQRVLGEG